MAATKSLTYLNQCLNILEVLRFSEPEILLICEKLSRKYQEIGDSKNMLKFAKKAKNWILEV